MKCVFCNCKGCYPVFPCHSQPKGYAWAGCSAAAEAAPFHGFSQWDARHPRYGRPGLPLHLRFRLCRIAVIKPCTFLSLHLHIISAAFCLGISIIIIYYTIWSISGKQKYIFLVQKGVSGSLKGENDQLIQRLTIAEPVNIRVQNYTRMYGKYWCLFCSSSGLGSQCLRAQSFIVLPT